MQLKNFACVCVRPRVCVQVRLRACVCAQKIKHLDASRRPGTSLFKDFRDVLSRHAQHLPLMSAFSGQIEICIKVKRVTHGKELCKPYLELLMGRIYAKHATSYSWREIMQSVFCINPS